MRPFLDLALIAAMAIGTNLTSAEEPKGDLARLQGTWTAKVGPNKDIPPTLTIKGNAIEITGARPGGEEFKIKGEIQINESASPKTIDWVKLTAMDGEELPENLAIYKLEGDSWTVCGGGPKNARPTEFVPGASGPPNVTTWARVKEKTDEKPAKVDLARFQGTWLAPAGPNDEVIVTMEVKDSTYTAKWDPGNGTKVELKGELRISDKTSPGTIDFINNQRDDGEDARDNLGIFAFEGEAMKVCLGGAGNDRPTEFKRGEDGTPLLLIFTKKKG